MGGVFDGRICRFFVWTAFLTFLLVSADDIQQQGMFLRINLLFFFKVLPPFHLEHRDSSVAAPFEVNFPVLRCFQELK